MPCRIYFPNYLGFVVVMVPKVLGATIQQLAKVRRQSVGVGSFLLSLVSCVEVTLAGLCLWPCD